MSTNTTTAPAQTTTAQAPTPTPAPAQQPAPEITEAERLKRELAANNQIRKRIINVHAERIPEGDTRNDRLLLEAMRDADSAAIEQLKIAQQDDTNDINKQLAANFGAMVRMATGNPHAATSGNVPTNIQRQEPNPDLLPPPELPPGIATTHSQDADNYETFQMRATELNLEDIDEDFGEK